MAEIKSLLLGETKPAERDPPGQKTPGSRRAAPNLTTQGQASNENKYKGAFAGLLMSNHERYVRNHELYAEGLRSLSKDPDTFVYEGEMHGQVSNAVVPPFFFACLLHYFQEKCVLKVRFPIIKLHKGSLDHNFASNYL